MSLYVVRCYGRLDVPEWIASHIVAGTWHGEVINEVLLEASLEESQRIKRMKNVLSVELAEPGVFPDDADGAVSRSVPQLMRSPDDVSRLPDQIPMLPDS